MCLPVFRTGGQSDLAISRAVDDYLERTAPTLPEGIRLTSWMNQGAVLIDRLGLMLGNGFAGLALVFVVLAGDAAAQGGAEMLCSAAGALCVTVICLFLADEPQPRQRAWALGLLGVFASSFVATLAFFLTMDRYWSPDGEWAAAIETVWALSYTLMLVGLGGTVMASLLAGRRWGAAAAGSA